MQMDDWLGLRVPISLARPQRQPSQKDSRWDHAYSSIHRQIYEGAAERGDRWDGAGCTGGSESGLGACCWMARVDLSIRMKI